MRGAWGGRIVARSRCLFAVVVSRLATWIVSMPVPVLGPVVLLGGGGFDQVSQPRVRLGGFLGQKRLVVVFGLDDDVPEKAGVRFEFGRA